MQLIDVAPNGTRYYLQRGMLKTSHRAVNEWLSDKRADGSIYRPFRPHTNPTPVEIEKTYSYLVEDFPVGHSLRGGHRLMLKLYSPADRGQLLCVRAQDHAKYQHGVPR